MSAPKGGKLNRTARGVRWPDRPARLVKVALATAAAFALAFGGFALAGQVPVQLGPDGPQPETVTVNWSDTVAFTNADTEVHAILIPSITVTSPDIPPGGTFVHVFDQKKGTFAYVQTGSKRRTGRVVVKLQGQVVLKAVPDQVVFGQTAALSGTSPYPSSPVVISQRPIGGQTETQITTVTAANDGSFSASFRPQSGSRLQASVAVGQLRSPLITVKVAPRVTIAARPTTVKAGRTVTVTGRLAPADVVERVHLERYDAKRKEWNRLDTRPASPSGAVVFRWQAEKGSSLLRLRVTRADLKASYVPTVSRSAVVRGLTVTVIPRLTIAARPTTVRAGRAVTVTGRLAPADAANRVDLERYNAKRKKWDRLSTRRVSRSGAVVFRWRADKGKSLLRLRTMRSGPEPGFVPTVSRTVAVNGLSADR